MLLSRSWNGCIWFRFMILAQRWDSCGEDGTPSLRDDDSGNASSVRRDEVSGLCHLEDGKHLSMLAAIQLMRMSSSILNLSSHQYCQLWHYILAMGLLASSGEGPVFPLMGTQHL